MSTHAILCKWPSNSQSSLHQKILFANPGILPAGSSLTHNVVPVSTTTSSNAANTIPDALQSNTTTTGRSAPSHDTVPPQVLGQKDHLALPATKDTLNNQATSLLVNLRDMNPGLTQHDNKNTFQLTEPAKQVDSNELLQCHLCARWCQSQHNSPYTESVHLIESLMGDGLLGEFAIVHRNQKSRYKPVLASLVSRALAVDVVCTFCGLRKRRPTLQNFSCDDKKPTTLYTCKSGTAFVLKRSG